MARVLLFASVAEAAGTRSTEAAGSTVREVLDKLIRTYGDVFESRLQACRYFVDGEAAESPDMPISAGAELAILPPVSGG